MSAKRKSVSLIVALAMLVSCFSFGAASVMAKTTEADTPVGPYNAHPKWEKKLGEGFNNAVTPPLLLGDYLYVGAAGSFYKLNKDTGAVVDQCQLEGLCGFTTLEPGHNGTAADGSDATRLYVQLCDRDDSDPDSLYSYKNGRLAAIDISGEKMSIVSDWPDGGTEVFGNQAISPVVYHNGKLYTGGYDTSVAADNGRFVEIDAQTGAVTTLATNTTGGFYWAGAYVTDEFAVFGEEAVSDKNAPDYGKSRVRSVATSGNSVDAAGALIDSIQVEGTVRGTMVDRTEGENTYLYFVTQAKKFYKVKVDQDGGLEETASLTLSGASVGVPQITETRAYVGTSAAKVDVIDLASMTVKYSVNTPGYPQGEMLIKKKDANTDYIYGSYNKKPGGLFFIEAGSAGAVQSGVLYNPEGKDYEEFCISPVIYDDEGVLFFKNDSGHIFAVISGIIKTAPALKKESSNAASTNLSWGPRPGAASYEVYRATTARGSYKKIAVTASRSYMDKTTLPKTAYYYKVRAKITGQYTNFSSAVTSKETLAKPKATTKAGKKKITVTWKKVTGATGYKVYRATKKSGKYKLVKTIKKQSTVKFINKKLKKNKKYYYKVRAFKTVSGKMAYSAYSNISYKKAK